MADVTPPTDDATKFLGWAVALLMGVVGWLWRTLEKGRTELKEAHARELAALKEAHAKEVGRLEAELTRERENVRVVGMKLDQEREGRRSDADRVARTTISRRAAYDVPSEHEEELPTMVRERLDVMPRSNTPQPAPLPRSRGRY